MKNLTVLMMGLMMSAPAMAKLSTKVSNSQPRNAASARMAAEPKNDVKCDRLTKVASLTDNTNPAKARDVKANDSKIGVN